MTGLLALCVLQSPGLISADTKLDLIEDPAGYLAASLHAWAPRGQFGEVQNQAYGYLWPMGPFFLAGHALGIPQWLIQRLWWGVVLCVGFEGTRRLLERWGIGSSGTRIVAAVAYVLAPRVIGLLGTTSIEAWPAMVLPWLLLPLARTGSPARAALLSGAAALLLGGVNATANIAVLVVPTLWLLLGTGLDRRAVRLAWWSLATLLACAWWLLPLLVLSRSAFPFLDLIESTAVTTAVTSLFNTLRGAEHWVAYSGTAAGPSWSAGFELATRPVLVVATALVGAIGLVGLGWPSRRIPQQRFLAVTLLVGTTAMAVGYAGAHGSPVADQVRALLDGPLAPLRNVHKLDPLVRLPLAAGIGHALALALAHVGRPASQRPRPRVTRWVAPAAVCSLGAVLAVAFWPFLAGGAASRGAFDRIPDSWRAAASWLDQNVGTGRVLVLPSSNFGEYTWGRPVDEPLASLSHVSWVLRNAVPLGAPGATRWMDAVDEAVRSGRGDEQLADVLASVGIGYVLLRNDLSVDLPRTPTASVRAGIAGSPGLVPVAAFGGPAETFLDNEAVTGSFLPQELEVFRVDRPVVRGVVATGALVVRGGPEAAATHGLAQVPWIAAEDTDLPADVTTDTMLRRSQNFGAERGFDTTPVLTAADDSRRSRAVSDVSPFDEGSPRTATRLVGQVRTVSATSSRADPFRIGYVGPQARPFLAVDGDPTTSWLPGLDDDHPELTVVLDTPVNAVTVRLVGAGAGAGAGSVETVTIGTSQGSAQVDVVDSVARAQLPARETTLTIGLPPASSRGAPGIAEIDGLVGRTVEVRDVPEADAAGFVVRRLDGSRRACVDLGPQWACNQAWARSAEERGPVARPGPVAPAGEPVVRVRAAEGPALESVLDRALGVRVSTSSRAFDDSAARGGAAVDADPQTAWVPDSGDLRPRLDLVTASPRVASSFRLGVAESYEGLTATVLADGQVVARGVTPGEVAPFPRVRASRWTVLLTPTIDTPLPLRVVELDFGWGSAAPVTVGCDAGLGITVGNRSYPVGLTTSVPSLTAGTEQPTRPCPSRPATTTADGLRSDDLSWLQVTTASWLPDRPDLPGQAAVAVTAGDAETRTLTAPAGPSGRILVFAEGANPGWQATLVDGAQAGASLRPVRVRGWQQAWELPELDAPTTVVARFEPGAPHRQGLALGAVTAVAVLGAAGALARRVPAGPPVAGAGTGVPVAAIATGLGAVATLTAGLAGGVVAGGTLALCLVGRERPWVMPAVVGSATLVASAAAVWSVGPDGLDQLACVAALAGAAAGLARHPTDRVLDDVEGGPSHADGDDRDGAQQEQGMPAEQRDAQGPRHPLEDQQMPEEHAVAD